MSWRPCSSLYEDTPIIKTTDRKPTRKDGLNVFAREHWTEKWFTVRWSHVQTSTHAEWRQKKVKKKGATP